MAKRHGYAQAVYNASGVTLADGDETGLFVDASGNLLTASGTGASSNQVQGTAADNAVAVGNPVQTGAVYNSSNQTYVSGDIAANQATVNGFVRVDLGTLIAGEDQTYNRLLTSQKLTYSAIAVADVQIKGSAGILGNVTISCNDAAPTAGSIIIYDSLTETGTQVFNHTFTTTPFTPFTVSMNYNMLTGIYVGFTTTADVNVTVGYI